MRETMGARMRSGSLALGNMCACKVTCDVMCWCIAVAVLLHLPGAQGQSEHFHVVYSETPLNATSRTSATFAFDVVGGDGANPCAAQRCSFECKVSAELYVVGLSSLFILG